MFNSLYSREYVWYLSDVVFIYIYNKGAGTYTISISIIYFKNKLSYLIPKCSTL